MSAYTIPTVKTPQIAIFVRVGNCNLTITGTGSPMIMKSVEILNTALAYQNAVMLMHSPPPGIDLSNA